MDRQIKDERAWLIPYYFSLEVGGFEFKRLQAMDFNAIKSIFVKKKFHRFNEIMAKNFYNAIQKIHLKYGGDASKIWAGKPKSATIVRRFLEFDGIGIKIATMATNILARDFKIPMQDRICIEISPDVHVKRVFKRIGFIGKEASNEDLIYCAKELNPEYPGIFDYPAFEIGRHLCRPKKPKCQECYLNQECPKII